MIDHQKPKLRNCPLCGKIFTDTGLGICLNCYEKNRHDEKVVIEYVREHPNSTIKEICEETGANIRLVTDMVQRGQFIASGGQVLYPCSRCGKPISSGIYCPRCIVFLHKAIRASNERAKSRQRAGTASKESNNSLDNRQQQRLHWMRVRDKE